MIRLSHLVLAVCALSIAGLSGCKRAPEHGDRVAFLLSTLQEERYQKDKSYFEAHAKKLGLDVISFAADNDNSRQLGQLEDALTRGAKVIVVQPTDSAAAAAYVKIAHREGVKLIAYDRAIFGKGLDFYVSHDSHQVGALQARAALQATGGKGNYVILSGEAGHSVAAEITRGYKDTLRKHMDRGDVKVIAEQSHSAWSPGQALRTVEDVLSRSGGKIDAILANNSGLARGAVQAIQSAGLGKVFIAGADADAANVNYVCQGKQSVEVLKDIAPLAHKAAEVAAGFIRGKPVKPDLVMTLGGHRVPAAAVRVALIRPDTVKKLVVESGFLAADALPRCADKLAKAPSTIESK